MLMMIAGLGLGLVNSGGGSSMRLGGLRQGHNCTLPKAVHRGV